MRPNYTYAHNIRVRYAETDTMGILHHSVYPVYFEEGRTELMRSCGLSYDEMEKRGVILPVYSLEVHFNHPAYYDDLLSLETTLAELEGVRIRFDYALFNEIKKRLATGSVTLVFTDAESFKPIRPPAWFLEVISRKG